MRRLAILFMTGLLGTSTPAAAMTSQEYMRSLDDPAPVASPRPAEDRPRANPSNPHYALPDKPDSKCDTCDATAYMNAGYYDKAFRILKMRAEQGDPVAMNNLGWMYEYGLGLQKDLDKAFYWYDRSGSTNYHVADGNLTNVAIDWLHAGQYNKALDGFEKAAGRGNAMALNELGYMYQHGNGVAADNSKALYYYRLGAAGGSQRAMQHVQELQGTR